MNPAIDISVNGGEWAGSEVLAAIASRAVAAAVDTAGLSMTSDAELSLVFTDDTEMRAINRQWRGIDKPTNVLSFPGSEAEPGGSAGPFLGDIVLAYQTVAGEARLDGKAFDSHLAHLVIHGFLHLFGYDHENEDDAAIMEELERRALASLGIADPYADH